MTQRRHSSPRLVGDVGGTNVRFALADGCGPALQLRAPESFLCADFASLEEAVAHYLRKQPALIRPEMAVIAVAGPVKDGAAKLTNAHWQMSETALVDQGFLTARLINDYAALALSVVNLRANDLATLGDALPAAGTVAIVGAGTGLGVSALVRAGDSETLAVTEGGHVAFAPGDDTEIEILRLLSRRFGRVSLERILSGPGLSNLHSALAQIGGLAVEPLGPGKIVERAEGGDDPLCVDALNRFCAIYGAAAGDLALSFGATGGVYLAGGIAPRILNFLRRGAFRRRFEAKGRFASYVTPIATQVILPPYAALLGAADG